MRDEWETNTPLANSLSTGSLSGSRGRSGAPTKWVRLRGRGRVCNAGAVTVTEDGFMAEPTRAGGAIVMLTNYHSADTSRDGRLSLLELTRVIELFDMRVGTARTGAYRLQAGSEDGFAPGP